MQPALPPLDHASNVRLRVALSLAAVAVIAYISRTSIAAAESTIRADLGLSEQQMGYLFSAFFWSYALTQIPMAWLGERFGPRLMLALLAIAGSLAVGSFAVAGTFLGLLAARVTMGVAQAGLFPCATLAISKWHLRGERARASGLLGASMQLGHGIGLALTGLLMGWIGWRLTFASYALPGFLWAWLFYLWFRDEPSQHRQVSEGEWGRIKADRGAAPSERHATPWLALALSPAMWLICGQQFFRAAGQVFFASWFATYLQEAHGVTIKGSAWLTAIPVVAIMTSALMGGALSDAIYRLTGSLAHARKSVAGSSLLLCALIIGSAYFVSDAAAAVALISLGVFFAGFAGPCAYAVTIDMGGRHVGAVFGAMNMVGNIGAAVFPMLVPPFRRLVQEHLRGAGSSPESGWAPVLILFASMYLCAALCWMKLRVVEVGSKKEG